MSPCSLVTYLVEHHRPAVRLLELANASHLGARERTALMTEELRLEELSRKRGAVDLHERAAASGRAMMNGARHELLADAAFPPDEHGDVAVRDLFDHRRHRAHLLAGAPDRSVLVITDLLAQLGQLGDESILLNRVADRDIERDLAQPFGIVRLNHVVGGSEADGLHDGGGLIAPGQHDDLRLRAGRLQRAQRRHTVEPGHHDVEQHDVRRIVLLLDRREHFVAAGVAARIVSAQREEGPEVRTERRVIVNDRNVSFHRLVHLVD